MYFPEMTSKWEGMRTAVSDLPSARLDFCFKKSIFVSNELLRIVQKHSEIPSLQRKDCGRRALTNTSESVRKVINSG